MSTLSELENAAGSLSTDEKEALLRFLAVSLRKDRTTSKLRVYSDDEVTAMIAEDEADGVRVRERR